MEHYALQRAVESVEKFGWNTAWPTVIFTWRDGEEWEQDSRSTDPDGA